MENKVISRIESLISYLQANKDRLTIDTDTHPTDLDLLSDEIKAKYESTPNYYQGRPISTGELLLEMNMAKVDMALCWQNPAAFSYSNDIDKNYNKLLAANQHIFESAQAFPKRIIPAGWTDPKALGIDNALKLVDHLMLSYGFFIVKMNPAQNAYPIDSEDVIKVMERIVGHGGVPAFHYGGDTQYTPPEGLETLAKRFSNNPIIAVHMGGGGSGYIEGETTYLKTRELGLKYPNLKFAISAKRDTHIESDIITYQLKGSPFSTNLFCASDAPYGRQTWNFGGFNFMLDAMIDSSKHTDRRVRDNPHKFDENLKRNILGRNFAEFVIEFYSNFLEKRR